MKKFLAMFLTALLVLSMGVVAMADADTTNDDATVTITKTYKAVNGGVSPAETFTFSAFTQVDIKDNPDATWPKDLPTITSIAYTEGAATAAGATATATITLPTYTAVGVYTYSFNEVTPTTKTAGVTYNSTTLYLVVTVIEGTDDQLRVAAVHCEGSRTAGKYGQDPKTDKFENKYESGTLAVSKSVTGNMGDKSKYFNVTVTFEAADGEVINSTIKYSGGKYDEAVTVVDNTATIQVKDGDTVTFTNIPEGVTWKVEEADYTKSDGYDEATYDTQSGVMTVGGAATSTITNNLLCLQDLCRLIQHIGICILVIAHAFVVLLFLD